MARQIFVNLAVRDLERAIAFFTHVGFQFNPQFTDANASCMVVDERIHVMLLVEPFFQTFTPKPLCDARSHTETLVCLAVDSRAEVDQMVARAVTAGGRTVMAVRDFGFMYQHGFEDLDGHLWELVYLDPNGAPEQG